MTRGISFSLLLLFLLGSLTLPAQEELAFSPDDIDIPYTRHVLPNGLRLLIHEDHKAPIVAVNVWYHVGSKDEKPGKTGFAHLFEHLMFNGSEHFNDDYFQALEKIGATDLNGTTNTDRTNYFQNVPVAGFEQVLWLESDRMGHLLGAIDQEKLDEQRGVVQNEKRQGENQPYGRQYDLLTKAMHPKGHPYSWTTIGEMEDLDAASLEDVKEWFRTYYGAANAVISIAGDVEAEAVYEQVLKYFGDIPSGPTLVRQEINVPRRDTDTRQVYEDRVPEVRIVRAWNTPQLGSRENVMLDLVAAVLASGKNSRLYKKLVYEDQTASNASAFQWSKELSSNFILQVNVKPGADEDEIEATMERILEDFLEDGPTEAELARVKSSYFSSFIKGLERIGGFGGKSDVLATNEVYYGDPEFYKQELEWVAEASPEDLTEVARKWLREGSHTLIARPFPEYATTESSVDRSQGLPELGEAAAAAFPDLQQTTLSNGMTVVLAQRPGVPTVQLRTIFDAGYAADKQDKAGLARLSMNMLDEGTDKLSSLEINEQLQLLGASLSAYSDQDASYVSMSTLKPTLEESLDLYAEVMRQPAFPQREFDRLRDEQLNAIKQEQANPVQMALRTFPRYLYGEDHPYSNPFTGSGYEASVQNMNRQDVVEFYENWIVPNNATLMVVGDISMDQLKPLLEQRLGDWQTGKVPKKGMKTVAADANKGKVFLMDRPESQQSVIIAGYLVDPYGELNEVARETMVNILGGDFTSRLNMNLREDKHWAYGAGTIMWETKGQRPFIAYAPVQTDKTAESAAEIIKEFTQFTADKPVTEEEFAKTTNNMVLKLPGRWETNGAVMNDMTEQIKFELDDDYYQRYDQMVRGLDLEGIRQVGRQLVRADQLTFFIVGDKETFLPKLQDMDFHEIVLVDSDGNPVDGQAAIKP